MVLPWRGGACSGAFPQMRVMGTCNFLFGVSISHGVA
jgi:hypothetical protein